MKNLSLLLSLVLLLSLGLSGFAQKSFKSDVKEVTVYLNGAEIRRTATVDLQKGENEVVLTGMTTSLNQATVKVDVPEGVVLGAVKYQVNFAGKGSVPPAIQAKQDSLEDARFDLKAKRALKETYSEELEMIRANRKIASEQSVLLVEDIQDMADFFRERIKEVKYKTIELEEEEQELNFLINRLTNELASMRALQNRNTGEVMVRLKSPTARKAEVGISYYVWEAGWVPSYDLRAADTDSPIILNYGAKVRQSTGNDWEGVALTLSSGNPVVDGNPPDLTPWRLYLQNQYRKQANKTRNAYSAQAPAMEGDAMNMEASYDVDEVRIDRKMMATTFEVATKYDIPSNNQYYDVALDVITLPADYRHFSVPKYLSATFLTAAVTEWEKYSLLPGEANIYFQGDFVGNSFIDPMITTDTLQLSLGQDPGVVITHEKVNDFCKTTTFGGKKTTSRAYKITAMNTRPKAVELRVEDQVPLSSDDDISVDIDELSGGQHDEESGKVTWNITLQPGESKELMLKFSVKYPRKKPIANL